MNALQVSTQHGNRLAGGLRVEMMQSLYSGAVSIMELRRFHRTGQQGLPSLVFEFGWLIGKRRVASRLRRDLDPLVSLSS